METQMQLEHKIELRWLILFALPTIFSNIFGNLYTAVDGIFVARFVDTDALSAINISMPMAYLASALGMMFGTGGNALIAKKIGEGKQQEALEDFSLLMAVAFLFSLVLSALCFIFLAPLCRFLGSDEALLHYCPRNGEQRLSLIVALTDHPRWSAYWRILSLRSCLTAS